jgi:hypothetical protein
MHASASPVALLSSAMREQPAQSSPGLKMRKHGVDLNPDPQTESESFISANPSINK